MIIIFKRYISLNGDVTLLEKMWLNNKKTRFYQAFMAITIAANWKTCYELKFFLVGCARSNDRATLTDIFTDDTYDDDELLCFRVKLRVPWQASRLLRA